MEHRQGFTSAHDKLLELMKPSIPAETFKAAFLAARKNVTAQGQEGFINCQDNFGYTLSHWAAVNAREDIRLWLSHCGANQHIPDKTGKNAKQLSLQTNQFFDRIVHRAPIER